jgi:hypothetical protein
VRIAVTVFLPLPIRHEWGEARGEGIFLKTAPLPSLSSIRWKREIVETRTVQAFI